MVTAWRMMYVVEGGERGKAVVRKWGLMVWRRGRVLVLLRDAYRETAPELVAQEYARTVYRVLIDKDKTFG